MALENWRMVETDSIKLSKIVIWGCIWEQNTMLDEFGRPPPNLAKDTKILKTVLVIHPPLIVWCYFVSLPITIWRYFIKFTHHRKSFKTFLHDSLVIKVLEDIYADKIVKKEPNFLLLDCPDCKRLKDALKIEWQKQLIDIKYDQVKQNLILLCFLGKES